MWLDHGVCMWLGGGGNVLGETEILDKAGGGWRRVQTPGQKDVVNLLEEFDFIVRATVSHEVFYLRCANQICFSE